MYRGYIKRLLDIVLVVFALLLASPVMLFAAILVRVSLGSPVFFRQLRPGLRSRPFRLLKFRTMLEAGGKDGNPLPDSARLTPAGRFLRSTSMDELPELLNVLKGEMSFVGPRPLLTQYIERYTPFQMRRHEVKPGITGWAQVNGRNALSWEQKFELDVWYVDHVSFLLDLKILVLTLWKIVARESISHEGHATMPEFLGSGNTPSKEGRE